MIDVGLVGFGLAGRCFHAPVIEAVPGLRLAAILQRTGDEAAKLYPHARIVRSMNELLAIDSLLLIVIVTPNQSHFPLAMEALAAGRDVVVDKPFTTTVAEATQLLEAAQQKNRLLTVYHNRRFDGDFQALRKVIGGGALGEVVRFESCYDRYRPVPRPNAWREKRGPGSGVFFDLAPHLIDHALVLLGAPEAVTADIRTERTGFETDDAFDVTLHYSEGRRAILSGTMLGAVPRPRFLVASTLGGYLKHSFDPLEPALRSGALQASGNWNLPDEAGFLTRVDGDTLREERVPGFGDWRDFYANVRNALLGKEKLLVTTQQALDVMVAMELGVESSKARRTLPWKQVKLGS